MNDCTWTGGDNAMCIYHDEEWGIPLHDDTKLFELLMLETFQAGLSWKIVLHKRDNFRVAFDNFEARKIVFYDESKIQSLMLDTTIIRNQLKIRAAVSNAQAFLKIQEEFGSFDKYSWQFTNGKTQVNYPATNADVSVSSEASDAMSKDLKKRGFKFVGSTICYAFMQAAGIVNDHLLGCSKKQ